MADSEQGEIPKIVLENAKKIAKKISSKSEFSVLFSVERIGQTINIPTVDESHITIKRRRELWFFNDRFGLYSFLIISAISILIFYLLIKD
jgi:hypothetical protein